MEKDHFLPEARDFKHPILRDMFLSSMASPFSLHTTPVQELLRLRRSCCAVA